MLNHIPEAMTGVEKDDLIKLLKERELECRIHERSYQIWLKVLTPIRWSSISVGVILPSLASVTVFSEIWEANWQIISGSVLLISGIVSGLHSALKCDTHQTESTRMSKRYSLLAENYRELLLLMPNDLYEQAKALGKEYKQLRENTLVTPAQWCEDKARNYLTNKRPSVVIA